MCEGVSKDGCKSEGPCETEGVVREMIGLLPLGGLFFFPFDPLDLHPDVALSLPTQDGTKQVSVQGVGYAHSRPRSAGPEGRGQQSHGRFAHCPGPAKACREGHKVRVRLVPLLQLLSLCWVGVVAVGRTHEFSR